MITKIEKKKSKHLALQQIENKQLSIQFSLDGFSFCVTDLDLLQHIIFLKYKFNNKILNPITVLSSIKKIFIEEPILQEKYNKVVVIHVNNFSTFVPKALFDKDNLANYIKFNNKIFESDFFTYDTIANQDMFAVYVPYVNINNFFIDQFGTFDYKHSSSILVEKTANEYVKNNATYFFINVAKNHFDIVVHRNKKLQLYNTFSYTTKEDFIYYILFVMEQLKLDVERIPLILLGEIKEGDTLYEELYKYIRNVSFLEENTMYDSIIEIDETIKRENFILFKSI